MVTGLKLPLVVGEPVNLSLKMTPAATDVQTYSWGVTGTTVKNYDHATGTKTDLAGADMKNTSISFFWTTAGTWRASIAVNSQNVTKTANVDFIVAAPTAVTLTAKGTSATPPVSIRDKRLVFGDPSGEAGIYVSGKCTPPTKGQAALIQLISSKDAVEWNYAFDTSKDTGGFVLDNTTNAPFYNAPVPAQMTADFDDTPGTVVVNLTHTAAAAIRTDEYKTYYMYKSDTAGSIWVPIAMVEWNWNGKVTQAAGVWTFISRSPVTASKKWNGKPTTEFPEWTETYR